MPPEALYLVWRLLQLRIGCKGQEKRTKSSWERRAKKAEPCCCFCFVAHVFAKNRGIVVGWETPVVGIGLVFDIITVRSVLLQCLVRFHPFCVEQAHT